MEQNSANSASSDDSGVVTSDRMANVIVPNFVMKACQKLPRLNEVPFTQIGKQVREWKEDLSKAIVPVQPVMHCILIKVWATMYEKPVIPCTPGGQITIPRVVTKKPGARTPLVDTLVRRSPCINPTVVDGFQMVPVKVKQPAPKRRMKITMQLDLDKKLPSDVSEVINPTSLENIKEWAQACGVVPEELSDDVLLKGRDENQA